MSERANNSVNSFSDFCVSITILALGFRIECCLLPSSGAMSDKEYNTILLAHPDYLPCTLGPSPKFKEGDTLQMQASPTQTQQAPAFLKTVPWGYWRVQKIVWSREPVGWVQYLYVLPTDLHLT